MGGTFDLVLISDGLDLVRSLSVGTVRSKGVGTCTLLGPEGPGRLPSGGGVEPLDPFLTPGCVGEGYRPYFENYTVDASILDSGSLCGLFGSTRFARCSLRVVFLQIIGSATFRVVVS